MFLGKIAPGAIFLAAAGVEFAVLDLLPDLGELIGNKLKVFGPDLDAFAIEIPFVVGLYKIEAGFEHVPVLAG